MLMEKKKALQARIDEVTADVRHTAGPLDPDFAEQAVEREHEEVMDALGEASRKELAAVNRAITRIESGDYGVCVDCGEKIPPARLKILPYSDRCVSCAEMPSTPGGGPTY